MGRGLKFELLESRMLLAADWGDAPAPYPTLLAGNGPSHEAVGPQLGALRDAEADGQPSAAADGDGADDDGISFSVLRAAQLDATVVVTVANAPSGARLSGWIDFNADGSWGGPGEQLFDSTLVAQGSNTLKFDVPVWAASGTSFARFRLSTNGGLGVAGGAAASGEIEDFAVTIQPPQAGLAAFVAGGDLASLTSTSFTGMSPADIDGDGDLDFFAPITTSSTFQWYENNGAELFTLRSTSHSLGSLTAIVATDIDGDGDTDAAFATNNSVVGWAENINGAFTVRSAATIPSAVANSIAAADMDRDGDIDLLSSSSLDNTIAWYENNGTQSFTRRVISTAAMGATEVATADIDGDGDLDVLSSSASDSSIAWYENNGSQTFTRRVVANDALNARGVTTADIDRDGDLDILAVSAADGDLTWYENDGLQNWTRRLIATFAGVSDVQAADIDGDGDLDLLASKSTTSAPLRWYVNDGAGNFAEQVIVAQTTGVLAAQVADIDGDGVIDLLAMSSTKIAWYRQQAVLDFGDAPAPYATTAAENGAGHFPTGPRLGAARDAEGDGAHSAGADGEASDDDGVVFSDLRVGDATAMAVVNVQDAPLGARVDAWIDFDGDGNWNGPGEHVADNRAVTEGDNVITFAVPSDAVAGATFARVRLSTAGRHAIGSGAADGEVEDYAMTILATAGTGVFRTQRVITSSATSAGAVVAADFDGDGDMDVAYSALNTTGLDWFQNTGAGAAFTRRTITTATTSGALAAADVDGDGDMDLIARMVSTVAWYENNGQGNFTARVINSTGISFSQILPCDFEGDGDIDIVTPTATGMVIYSNNGAQLFTATSIALGGGENSRSLDLADLDGDGDLDVLSAQGSLSWTELNGLQTVATRSLTGFPSNTLAQKVTTGDYDGDGDADIVVYSTNQQTPGYISLFINNGNRTFTASSIRQGDASQLKTADVDGDGDLDVLIASFAENAVQWLENNGAAVFTKRTLVVPTTGARGVDLADIDGDGDLDILSASSGDNKVAWYEQLQVPVADYGDAPAPYPVAFVEGGATHVAVGPQLGATRTSELNAVHTPNAGGAADDDGVILNSYRVGQTGATLTVDVQNAPAGAKLDAWIDFNRDGTWNDFDERISFGKSVVQGSNVISFNVPALAADGVTYARFRLSTAGKLNPGGAAVDGEVEDYAVTISPPSIAAGFFAARGAGASLTSAAAAGDLDGDGDLDLVVSTPGGPTPYGTVWYANDGNQNFTYRTTVLNFFPSQQGRLFTFDMDGDGDLDVLSSADSSPTRWSINNGSGVFTPSQLTGLTGSRFATPVDMDRDGDIDVFLGATWLENTGAQSGFYVTRTISTSSSTSVSGATIADFDRDGDLDVMLSENSSVSYYQNNGLQSFTRSTIPATPQSYTAQSLQAVDWDGDGDLDAVGGRINGSALAWFENTGSTFFTVRSIPYTGTIFSQPLEVVAADIDGDGDLDLTASSNSSINATTILKNLGNQTFVASGTVGGNKPSFVDLDRDGDLDIVPTFTNFSFSSSVWYENVENTVSMTLAAPTSVAEESTDNLVYTLTRFVDLTKALTVNLSYFGTATSGSDYTILGAASVRAGVATVEFPAGVGTIQLLVDPTDDAQHELAESVYFQLQAGPRYAILTTSVVQGRITSAEDDVDFGDAPAPYSTSLAESGALHFGNPGPWLGATIDFEADGSPSAAADGDGADEDGVVIPPMRVGQRGATVSVTASNVAAGARLDAWIDFDGDGSWGDGDERIARSYALVAGVNILTIDVPADAASGATYARFRVSAVGGLGVSGSAPNGEVEDYRVTIAPPLISSGVFASGEMVDASAAGASQLVSTDLDGDGDLDLVAASSAGAVWYERGAAGAWTLHALPADAAGAVDSVAVADVDGDGDLDLFAGSSAGNWAGWLENDGTQQFTVHVFDSTALGIRSLQTADVDGDGRLDLVGVFSTDSRVVRYRNGSSGFSRSRTDFTGAQALELGDVDRDGDVDALVYSSATTSLAWLYNSFGSFDEYVEAVADEPGATNLAVGDVNGDGQLDVIAASSTLGDLVWFDRAAGNVRHVIATLSGGVDSIALADLTGDGKLDIVAASHSAFKVVAYEQSHDLEFMARQVTAEHKQAASLSVADFDGDGDLDLAVGAAPLGGASSGPYAVQLYDNADAVPYLVIHQTSLSEEGGAAASVEFKRFGRLDEQLTVPFFFFGTAERNVDFLPAGAEISGITGLVTIPVGAESSIVTLTPIDDAAFELDETVTFILLPQNGVYPANPIEATLILTSAELVGDYDGDYDGDNAVTGFDFLAWQRQHGATGVAAGSGADGSRDGTVDAADLVVWQAAYSAASADTAVTAAVTYAEVAAETAMMAESSDVAVAPIAAPTKLEKDTRSAVPQSAVQRAAALDALYALYSGGDISSVHTGQPLRPFGRPRFRPVLR